jgi:hypothetical protein
MNVTEEHLHHMAKKLHHTNSKLHAIRAKFSGVTERAVRTVEVGAGAWLGGLVEGRTAGGTVMHVPINLGVGIALSAAGYLDLAGSEWSGHLNNFGDGFIASYVAATGYAFGKRWKETGKLFAAKAPAQLAAPVQGDLSEAQMAAIVSRMQQAAQAAAHG